MLIDWFTVGAQALNFVVLIWLMQRFLYRPVLAAIDAREARAVAELHAAREQQQAATRERNELLASRQEFDANREAGLRSAKDEATALRDQLLETARADEVAIRSQRHAVAQREAQEQKAVSATRMREAVFDLTRKVLGELAETSLETQLVSTFARHVASLPDEELDALRHALGATTAASGHSAILRSAFELRPEARALVRDSIVRLLGDVQELVFEADPSLLLGIELHVADRTVGWSMAGYIQTLERALVEQPAARD